MSPFSVQRILKETKEKMCIDTLSKKCGGQLSHDFFILSDDDDMFDCQECRLRRHYVKRISAAGWFKIWLIAKK